jgi:hypothetical protein
MKKYLFLILLLLTLQGCATQMSKEQWASIHTVNIAPITEIEEMPTIKMAGDDVIREYLVKSANVAPLQLSPDIDENYHRYFTAIGLGKRDVAKMLTEAFDTKLRDKRAFPRIVEAKDDADATFRIRVNSWGFGGLPFSTQQKPYLLLTVRLVGKNDEEYFTTVRSIDPLNEELTAQSPETMYNQPEMVRASLNEAANLAAELIVPDLMRNR